MQQEVIMAQQQEPKKQIMPLPYEAEIGDRLSDDGDCWVINCEQGSVAEMQCPADVEEATARFIVRAVNNHEALIEALKRVREAYNAGPSAERIRIAMDSAIDHVDAALSAAQE